MQKSKIKSEMLVVFSNQKKNQKRNKKTHFKAKIWCPVISKFVPKEKERKGTLVVF